MKNWAPRLAIPIVPATHESSSWAFFIVFGSCFFPYKLTVKIIIMEMPFQTKSEHPKGCCCSTKSKPNVSMKENFVEVLPVRQKHFPNTCEVCECFYKLG